MQGFTIDGEIEEGEEYREQLIYVEGEMKPEYKKETHCKTIRRNTIKLENSVVHNTCFHHQNKSAGPLDET